MPQEEPTDTRKVSDDPVRVVDAGSREGDDRHAGLDGKAREAESVTPQATVFLAVPLQRLARSARITDDEIAALEGAEGVPGAPVGAAEPDEGIAHERDAEERAVGEPDREPADARQQVLEEER